jgi:LysR family transcriptional regulator, hydrogen peroxide-inducible genes activator
MNLSQVRYFLSLAETLNFSKAAALSNISQPALTRAIQKLEEEIGGTLVYRDGKDTRLTSLGRELRDEFAAIAEAADRIRAAVDNRVLGRRETLNLGLGHSIGPSPISGFLTHVLEELPGLEILLHPINARSGPGLVLAGTLDGVFVADTPSNNPKLSFVELFVEPLVLACSKGHRLAAFDIVPVAELAGEFYLDRIGCEFRNRTNDYLMANDVVMQPRLQSEREDWVQQAVAEGAGVCLLPEFSAIVPGLVLRPVEGLHLERRVSFVSVSGSGNAPALRQIRGMIGSHPWPNPKRA